MARLNPKQARFINEYLIDLNATEAAKRAGYSAKNASSLGWQLLQKTTVQEALQAKRLELSVATGNTPEKVINERAALAYADVRKIFDADGCAIPPHEIPDEVAPAIAGIDLEEKTFTDREGNTTRTKTYKYRFWDKNRALQALELHFGLYQDGKPGGLGGGSGRGRIVIIEMRYEDHLHLDQDDDEG